MYALKWSAKRDAKAFVTGCSCSLANLMMLCVSAPFPDAERVALPAFCICKWR
jgi:hypothetical protein